MSKKHIDLSYVTNHDDFVLGLCSFLDEFKRSNNKEQMIEHPPPSSGIEQVNLCILAAASHKLANEYEIDVPSWVYEPLYKMPYPVFAFNTQNKEYQKFLLEDTPYEFSSKNIFHGANAIERV